MESVDAECKHGMNPEWCANCKGLKTPEKEEGEIDAQVEEFARRLRGD